MRVLLIHQNFPGQYKHLGPALAARGDEVIALTPKVKKPAMWNGVRILPYGIRRSSSKDAHADSQSKQSSAFSRRRSGAKPDAFSGGYLSAQFSGKNHGAT